MEFRKTCAAEVDAIMQIVEGAKMRLHAGGIDQWQRGYPDRMRIVDDVTAGVGMALCDGGRIAAYGAVIFSGEPAYDAIAAGRWLTDGEYVVVHRLCVAEEYLGHGCSAEFMRRVEDSSRGRVASIRVDTHPDNMIMQGLIRKAGFTYCGDVVIESRRMAYEKIL